MPTKLKERKESMEYFKRNNPKEEKIHVKRIPQKDHNMLSGLAGGNTPKKVYHRNLLEKKVIGVTKSVDCPRRKKLFPKYYENNKVYYYEEQKNSTIQPQNQTRVNINLIL